MVCTGGKTALAKAQYINFLIILALTNRVMRLDLKPSWRQGLVNDKDMQCHNCRVSVWDDMEEKVI